MLRQLRHVFAEPNGGKGIHFVRGIRSLYRGTKSELLSSAVAGTFHSSIHITAATPS